MLRAMVVAGWKLWRYMRLGNRAQNAHVVDRKSSQQKTTIRVEMLSQSCGVVSRGSRFSLDLLQKRHKPGATRSQSSAMPFAQACHVRIKVLPTRKLWKMLNRLRSFQGLVSCGELNGLTGRIFGAFDQDSKRWPVRAILPSGKSNTKARTRVPPIISQILRSIEKLLA